MEDRHPMCHSDKVEQAVLGETGFDGLGPSLAQ